MIPTRIVLGSIGIGLCAIGAASALTDLAPGQLIGLAVWLAAAVVVHDGIIAPATAGLSTLLERRGSRLRAASRGVIRVGFVVAAVLSLVVVPQVVAQSFGNPNPTVLPGPYAARLAWSLVSIALVTVVGVVLAQRSSRGRDT